MRKLRPPFKLLPGLLIMLFPCGQPAAPSPFVSMRNGQFFLDGRPYYYIGANYWYGGLLGLQADGEKGIERLQKELDFLHAKGVNNLRVLAGAEGSGQINGVKRVGPPLQPEPGCFDESVLQSLDRLLYEMGNRNMKAILYLSNNWEWSGGFLQYLNWNGKIPDSALKKKFSWDGLRDTVSRFYSCPACQAEYWRQAKTIIGRTNSFTHQKYTDDPTIMAWELANEPRPMRAAAIPAYRDWLAHTAAAIRSLDSHHLVTLGVEGEMGTENDLKLFEEIHTDKNVDYLTIHIWPKNWRWFQDTAIQEGMEDVVHKTMQYIEAHKAVAEKLKKPLVIEEFGLPRDRQSFDIHASVSLRDDYYRQVFSAWQASAQTGGVIAGCNFWAFGGLARPIPGQVFWKKGDDYMGDPPMEEQGLNTVFDSDTSTWNLIESFTKTLSHDGATHTK